MHSASYAIRGSRGFKLGLGVWGLAVACGVQACGGPTAPEHGEDVRIVLSVTGGFAGVDWQLTIDGRAGEIVGDRCGGGLDCDWAAGEVLSTIDGDGLLELARRFVDAGFLELRVTDFGTQCCDQFAYRLTYTDDDAHKTVLGSDGTLPSSVLDLIADVRGFVSASRSGP
jgi:hypothetical protein